MLYTGSTMRTPCILTRQAIVIRPLSRLCTAIALGESLGTPILSKPPGQVASLCGRPPRANPRRLPPPVAIPSPVPPPPGWQRSLSLIITQRDPCHLAPASKAETRCTSASLAAAPPQPGAWRHFFRSIPRAGYPNSPLSREGILAHRHT